MTEILKELYDNGYRLDGKGRRIDVIDSENRKYLEIFFFPNEVLIMTPYDYIWAKSIACIETFQGLPQLEVIC